MSHCHGEYSQLDRPTSKIEMSIFVLLCGRCYLGTQYGRYVLLVDLDAVEVRTWASLSWEMCSADLLRCRVGVPFDGGFGRRRDRVTNGKLFMGASQLRTSAIRFSC